MDFEKEMQKALRVIFVNIQALEDRDNAPTSSLTAQDKSVKRRQRTFSVSIHGSSLKSAEQKVTQRKKRGFTV